MTHLATLIQLKAYLLSLRGLSSAFYLPLKVYIDGDAVHRGYEVTLCVAQLRAVADGFIPVATVRDWYAMKVLAENWEGGAGGN